MDSKPMTWKGANTLLTPKPALTVCQYTVAARRVWVSGCACETIHNCCYRGDEGAIARLLEFGSSEKGTEREINTLLLSVNPVLKTYVTTLI